MKVHYMLRWHIVMVSLFFGGADNHPIQSFMYEDALTKMHDLGYSIITIIKCVSILFRCKPSHL